MSGDDAHHADDADGAHDALLSLITHDVRGTLHTIGLAVAALRAETTPTGQRFLAAIERATARTEALMADLLEADAIRRGTLDLAPAAVDLCALVATAVAAHGEGASAELPGAPVQVTVDPTRARQILAALLANTRAHAPGAPVVVTVARAGADARVVVRDRGPGFPADAPPDPARRYRRVRGRPGGAGVGLAIAHGLVAAHGGALTARTHPEGGAEITFTLPLAPDAAR